MYLQIHVLTRLERLIFNQLKHNMRRQNRKNRQSRKNYKLSPNNKFSNFENPRIGFLDPHKYVVLSYSQAISPSIASSAGAQQTMNLNSIFDPDRTGGGHQPYGHDELAVMYNRYRVLKTHYKVTFGTSTGNYHCVVGPVNGVQTNVSDLTTFQTMTETPRAVTVLQGGGGAPSKVITRSITLNNLTGVTQTEYLADDRFEATMGASPGEVLTLSIGFYNPTLATIVAYCYIELQFFVDLHDPIPLSGS